MLKNLARDWSAEAAGEREQSHGPIIRELTARLPPPKPDEGKYPPRVLIPGAGLGRLVMEIARRGYEAEGNEFSYYMLLTSSYVLNHADDANEWVIHPWVHSNCNHQSDAHQLATVRIPDVPAWSSGMNETGGSMSMCAGDFVECYGDEQNVRRVGLRVHVFLHRHRAQRDGVPPGHRAVPETRRGLDKLRPVAVPLGGGCRVRRHARRSSRWR